MRNANLSIELIGKTVTPSKLFTLKVNKAGDFQIQIVNADDVNRAFTLNLGVAFLQEKAPTAAPSAWWRFDKAHQIGSRFKALVGPDIPVTGTPRYVTDTQGESLALNNSSLTVADIWTKAAHILSQQNMTVSMWVALIKVSGGEACLGPTRQRPQRAWLVAGLQ